MLVGERMTKPVITVHPATSLPDALELARALATEKAGSTVFVGCESSSGAETERWLVVKYENEQIMISESEA